MGMRKTRKTKKLTTHKEDAGKVFVDVGKLVFGSIVFGSILRVEIPHYIMIAAGIVVALALCIIGVCLSAKEKNGKTITRPLKRRKR